METRGIEIPEDLYLDLEGRLEKLGMSSVDECVEFVLRSLLSGEYDKDELSKEEEQRMKERLADLGYM
ncbi:MAG: CopG family transcriptional regulator [Candidatus Eisenbacteria bacterium]|nr:CopG family transcriptional regulator [Candidatus Eisenbacteria bacterium]